MTWFHRAHPEGEPKNPHFSFGITNERIKLTSLLTISYITFSTTSEHNIYYLLAEYDHAIRVMNNLI